VVVYLHSLGTSEGEPRWVWDPRIYLIGPQGSSLQASLILFKFLMYIIQLGKAKELIFYCDTSFILYH